MEIIVENRRDPNETYKFFDVTNIRLSCKFDKEENRMLDSFVITYEEDGKSVNKEFFDWEYKFYCV